MIVRFRDIARLKYFMELERHFLNQFKGENVRSILDFKKKSFDLNTKNFKKVGITVQIKEIVNINIHDEVMDTQIVIEMVRFIL